MVKTVAERAEEAAEAAMKEIFAMAENTPGGSWEDMAREAYDRLDKYWNDRARIYGRVARWM